MQILSHKLKVCMSGLTLQDHWNKILVLLSLNCQGIITINNISKGTNALLILEGILVLKQVEIRINQA